MKRSKHKNLMESLKWMGIFTALLIGISCSNDDSDNTIVVDFQDNDGDGVANTIEQNAGTDPNDGCSFTLSQQEFDKTTEAWRGQDCDGDGVTNGDELDPDGNEINDGNGTDPLDTCDFDFTLQTLSPSEDWLMENCDGDCKTNGEEIEDGTDPTNPDDFTGGGSELVSITRYKPDGTIDRRALFEENGTRIKELLYTPDLFTFSSYTYDAEGKLIQYDGNVYSYAFEYQNGVLTSVTQLAVSGYTKTLTYNGSEIITDDGNAPPGYFSDKIILNPATGKAITMESFVNYGNPDLYYYTVKEFFYEPDGIHVAQIASTEYEYSVSTGEFWQTPGWVNESFKYSDTELNPAKDAFNDLYLHGLLIYELAVGAMFQSHCTDCPKLMIEHGTSSNYAGYTSYLEMECVQENLLPYLANKYYSYDIIPELRRFEYIYN